MKTQQNWRAETGYTIENSSELIETRPNQQTENPNATSELTYWKKQLNGNLPRLDLPADGLRNLRQAIRRATKQFLLNQPACEALHQIAMDHGTELFAILLAAFESLLFRYTGQTDLVVGTSLLQPSALPSLTGARTNTVLLRTAISAEMTFLQFLDHVRQVVSEAQAHAGLPFEKIAAELAPQWQHHQPVQVTINFQQSPLWDAEAECAEALLPEISASFEPRGQGLRGKITFDADLFEAQTIDRLIGHFQSLLEGVLANPGQKISRLPLLSEAEHETILRRWNDTKTEFPSGKCIHQLFEEQVERTPDHVALAFNDRQLTYRELNEKANRLAEQLRSLGVKPDVCVGVRMLRSIEMIIALYAIHKAGGAYLPLDPTYPQERIAFMLEDAKVPLLLTQKCLNGSIAPGTAKVLCVDEISDLDQHQPSSRPTPNATSEVNPENLAYVIYTSGSTGKPKGVMVRHKNAVNFFSGMDNAIGRDAGTWLAVTSISFDIHVLELFWPLTRGFKLVLHGDDAAVVRKISSDLTHALKDNLTLGEEARRHQVTHLQCTPSLAGMMLDDPATEQALRQVKTFLFGGEPLPQSLLNRIAPGARILNMYGPTETTVWSLVQPIDRAARHISIGRPIANTRIYILDPELQPVPVGVAGELYIGGEGVTRGYLNRPELTQERFIREQFVDDPEARIYRTGDLARFNADGSVDFLGRIDNQVKVRGYRIELGEIESLLRQQPGVKECVVAVWQPRPNDTRLVAYCVPQPACELQIPELRNSLRSKLPDYMVPSLFLRLDSLPLTPNGKIDRKALPVPTTAAPVQSDVPAPPTPPVAQDTRPAAPIIKTLPLTEAQREIWLGAQISDELSCSFNQSMLIEARGPLDTRRLLAGIEWLVHRHEALRVTFAPSGEEQWLHAAMPVQVDCLDLTQMPAASARQEVDRLLHEEAATSFDLAKGPLFRARLIKVAPAEHALLLTLHHLICDGGSLEILMSELGEYYSAFGKGAALPGPLEKTYSQFIQEQIDTQRGPERAEAEAFWLKECSRPGEPLAIPTDHPRAVRSKLTGATCELLLSAPLSESIKKLSLSRHCSMTATLLAGCYLLLQHLTRQSEISIGLPIAVRSGPGSDRLIGHCVNFLPLRLDFRGDPPFTDHLERVWGVLIQAIEHQQISLGGLLQKLNGHLRHHEPMISVMFNVDCVQDPIVLEGISTRSKANPYCFSRFDLSLSAAESAGQLAVRCEYSDELFDRRTIESWLKHYELLLSALVADPERHLSQFPQLPPMARRAESTEAVPVAAARAAAPLSQAVPAAQETMSETEKKLTDIWREVVLIDQVGKHDSFFDIGGHSLLATKVIARIAKVFAIDLPVRVIFEAPTIAELAQAVERAQRDKPKAATPAISRRSREADMQKLLGRLAQLSDSELQNLIQQAKSTTP